MTTTGRRTPVAFLSLIPLLLLQAAAGAAGDADAAYDVIIVGLGLTSSVTLPRLVRRHPHLRFAVVEKGGPVNEGLGGRGPVPPAAFTAVTAGTPAANLTMVDVPGLYEAMAFHPSFESRYKDPAHPWTFQGMAFGGNGAYNGAWVQTPARASFAAWPKGWGYEEVITRGFHSVFDGDLAGVCGITATPSRDRRAHAQGAWDAVARGFRGGAEETEIVDMDACAGRAVYGRPQVAVTGDAARCFATGVLRGVIDRNTGRSRVPNLDVYGDSEVVEVRTSPTGAGGKRVPEGVLVRRRPSAPAGDGKEELLLRLRPRTGRVVLAAGALGTAAALIRSGFHPSTVSRLGGPRANATADAQRLLAAAVRHVGAAVADHVGTGVAIRCEDTAGGGNGSTDAFFNPEAYPREAVAEYARSRSGPYAQFGPVAAFYNYSAPTYPTAGGAPAADARPANNVEVFVNPWGMGALAPGAAPTAPWSTGKVFSAFAMLVAPAARAPLGFDVETNATAYPMVYYPPGAAGASDMKVVSDVLSAFVARVLDANPSCKVALGPGAAGTPFAHLDPANPRDMQEYVGNWGPYEDVFFSHLIMNHFTGTVPLASARGAVDGAVDPGSLEVLGTERLHVCDASLAPQPIAAHPMGTLVGVGARCADILDDLLL